MTAAAQGAADMGNRWYTAKGSGHTGDKPGTGGWRGTPIATAV
ncbi:hypothetical protein [Comamonas sp. 4034]